MSENQIEPQFDDQVSLSAFMRRGLDAVKLSASRSGIKLSDQQAIFYALNLAIAVEAGVTITPEEIKKARVMAQQGLDNVDDYMNHRKP